MMEWDNIFQTDIYIYDIRTGTCIDTYTNVYALQTK